jgi:hypothetical protein
MGNEEVMAYFRLLSEHLPGGPEEKQIKKRVRPEYKSEVLPFGLISAAVKYKC